MGDAMKILRIDMNTLTSRDEDLPDNRKIVGGPAGQKLDTLAIF